MPVKSRKIHEDILRDICALEEIVKMQDWSKSVNTGFSKSVVPFILLFHKLELNACDVSGTVLDPQIICLNKR